jgi:hypothetical protein
VDEFSAILKAREVVAKAEIDFAPVDIERYLRLPMVNGVLRVDHDLPDDHAGSTTVISSRNCFL